VHLHVFMLKRTSVLFVYRDYIVLDHSKTHNKWASCTNRTNDSNM